MEIRRNAMVVKKKYWSIVPLIVIIFFIALYVYTNSYVEFSPTGFENDSFKKIVVSDTFNRNLETVLTYHKIDYKIDSNGKIMVKRNLVADKELMFNFTKKTQDTAWLKGHRNFVE